MDKILTLDFITNEDNWGIATSEEVHGTSDKGTKIDYYVHDLSDCPEDAILGRDLFSGYEFIETLQLGMKLAHEGYTDIVLNEVSEDDYYNDDDDPFNDEE